MRKKPVVQPKAKSCARARYLQKPYSNQKKGLWTHRQALDAREVGGEAKVGVVHVSQGQGEHGVVRARHEHAAGRHLLRAWALMRVSARACMHVCARVRAWRGGRRNAIVAGMLKTTIIMRP